MTCKAFHMASWVLGWSQRGRISCVKYNFSIHILCMLQKDELNDTACCTPAYKISANWVFPATMSQPKDSLNSTCLFQWRSLASVWLWQSQGRSQRLQIQPDLVEGHLKFYWALIVSSSSLLWRLQACCPPESKAFCLQTLRCDEHNMFSTYKVSSCDGLGESKLTSSSNLSPLSSSLIILAEGWQLLFEKQFWLSENSLGSHSVKYLRDAYLNSDRSYIWTETWLLV